MARFRYDEVEHYGGQGGSGFFYLKDDKDTALVRLMYNNVDDVEGVSVHEVEIGDKKRYVNCLREYGAPVDSCPFCREHMFTVAKLFVPLYDVDNDKVVVWERGKRFFGKITGICARYPDTVSHTFEIERNGKKGDTGTTYEIYETGQDDTTLEDLPELPKIIGGLVLDKTAEDMEYFLQEGDFPPEDGEPVVRRRTASRRSETADEIPDTPQRSNGRRTPVRNRTDAF